MTGFLRSFSILLLALGALGLTSQSAQAKRVWPVFGAQGEVGATPECKPGQMLVGFTGHAGVWTDQIAIVCADVQPNGMPGGPLPVGEYFGGSGGGPVRATCPANTRISSALIYITEDRKRVHSIAMECIDSNGSVTQIAFGSGSQDHATRTQGESGRYRQTCPQEEFAGITVRYGNDVNAVGFICERIVPPPPAPAQVRSYDPAPIRHTGRAKLPTGPAPVSDFAYIGVWSTMNDAGGHYDLTLTPLDPEPMPGSPVMLRFQGSFTNSDGANQYDGTLYGQVLNGSHTLNYTYAQPGSSQQGVGVFILSPDGNSLTGNGVANGKDKFAWNGTRKR